LKDFINIDGPEDNIEDDKLSNKPLDEGFYLILPLSIYNYLDYIDFFIFIRFKEVGKRAIAVIITMFVIVEISLIITIEIIIILETRLN